MSWQCKLCNKISYKCTCSAPQPQTERPFMSKTKVPDLPFVRSAYNYDTNQASVESGLKCEDPSLTQQQFKEESDINFIAKNFGLTGELPHLLNLPSFRDFEGPFDFQSAQQAVVDARVKFMALPANIRTRFDNDPQKLITFLDNPANKKEAEFLGLINPKPKEPAQPPKGDPADRTVRDPLSPTGKPAGEPTNKPDPT